MYIEQMSPEHHDRRMGWALTGILDRLSTEDLQLASSERSPEPGGLPI